MGQNQHEHIVLKPASTLAILRRCYQYMAAYRTTLVAAYLTQVLLDGIALVVPQTIRGVVDRGVRQGDLSYLRWMVGALLGLTLIKAFFTFLQGRWIEIISQGVAYDLRNELQRKFASLSFAFHDRVEAGQLLSCAIQDVDRIRFLTGRATLRLVEGALLMLGTAVVLVLMNPRLALFALALMPLVTWRALDFGRRYRPLWREVQDQMARMTSFLEQNFRGARIVKGFAQEEAEIARFQRENARWFALNVQATRLRVLNAPVIDFLAGLSSLVVIAYGGWLVIHGALTLGEMVAFSTYLAQLVQPLRRVGMVIPAIAQATASGERVFEILDTESEVREAPDALPLPPLQGHVQFERVSFAYFGRHPVLREVSFEVLPGQKVALLGQTGSGKTTLLNLLLRFYDPTSGRILIDGYDLRRVTLKSLREQIGIVLQESTLFATTIRENIAFGCPEATDEEVEAAARAAQAHDFIMELPQGYATRVGERGLTLSGGQRQRIAIARALLKNPRILILDDATASVDSETEHLIQRALRTLMQGRTTFIIAQRVSTLRDADLILVLEQGRIAARGTHAELLATSGLYAEIYYRQLRVPTAAAEGTPDGVPSQLRIVAD